MSWTRTTPSKVDSTPTSSTCASWDQARAALESSIVSRKEQRYPSFGDYALDLFESAIMPRTTVQVPMRWSDDPSWKDSYARVSPEELEKLKAMGDERR